MKRRDRISAPVRCYCAANGETVDEHGHFVRVRITDRVAEYVLSLRRALGREVCRERSLGWILSRSMLVLVAVSAMLILLELGKTTEYEMDMPRSKRINELSSADRNSVLDSVYDPQVQSIRQYYCH